MRFFRPRLLGRVRYEAPLKYTADALVSYAESRVVAVSGLQTDADHRAQVMACKRPKSEELGRINLWWFVWCQSWARHETLLFQVINFSRTHLIRVTDVLALLDRL